MYVIGEVIVKDGRVFLVRKERVAGDSFKVVGIRQTFDKIVDSLVASTAACYLADFGGYENAVEIVIPKELIS